MEKQSDGKGDPFDLSGIVYCNPLSNLVVLSLILFLIMADLSSSAEHGALCHEIVSGFAGKALGAVVDSPIID